MSSVYNPNFEDEVTIGNVTQRRAANNKNSKMATGLGRYDLGNECSLIIDSILSQEKAKDVVSMLCQAD